MPIVRIEMFPGRDAVTKEFLSRKIIDAVSEIAGTGREGVHVMFDDVAPEEWAIGPRLASSRSQPPSSGDEPALITVGTISVKPDKHSEYLNWRRNSVYEYMASHEGFVSSTLLTDPEDANQYTIINKWTSAEARDKYLADPREAQLRVEAKEFVNELVQDSFEGSVVRVFSR